MLDTKGKSGVSVSFFALQLSESMKDTLGRYIVSRRKELGLRQIDLANSLGYSVQAISKFENGLSQMDLRSLCSLAKVLSLSLDDLLHQREKPCKTPLTQPFTDENLGPNFVYLRTKNNLTQIDAATKGKISKRALGNYERGANVPAPSVFLFYCDYYKVSADDMIFVSLTPAIVEKKEETKDKKLFRSKVLALGGVSSFLAAVIIAISVPLWFQKKSASSGESSPTSDSQSASLSANYSNPYIVTYTNGDVYPFDPINDHLEELKSLHLSYDSLLSKDNKIFIYSEPSAWIINYSLSYSISLMLDSAYEGSNTVAIDPSIGIQRDENNNAVCYTSFNFAYGQTVNTRFKLVLKSYATHKKACTDNYMIVRTS
jgi:transcriptional regulator with XRE-family HTH domain